VESRKSEASTLDLSPPLRTGVAGAHLQTQLAWHHGEDRADCRSDTFITMAYIIFVNPNIMADAGIDHGAAFVATCIAAALGCLLMGLYANWPVGLAPGMGLNAFFTYTVVGTMGYNWETALGAVFVSGVLFMILTFSRCANGCSTASRSACACHGRRCRSVPRADRPENRRHRRRQPGHPDQARLPA
jgi:AGZA family xanthine/uracil permease-like MFS transporter